MNNSNNCCCSNGKNTEVDISNINNSNQLEKGNKNLIFYEKEPETKKCCFEVYITRCWLTHNKDINPKGGIIIMGYANQQSGVAPGIASYLNIHPKHGWVNINQKIGTFTVNENDEFPVLIRADALEWGEGLDGASDIGSDLEGDSLGEEIKLMCNSSKIIKTRLAIKLQRPNGGEAGRVAVEIAAFKTSCCN